MKSINVLESRNRSVAAFLFLSMAGIILYGCILNAPFVFDDQSVMLANPFIRDIPSLLQNWNVVPRKFITYLTFAVNYRIGGENPFGYHLFNVIVHISTGIIFYFVVQLLLEKGTAPFFKKGRCPLFSLAAALIFLTHPLQTESVTYVWQRSELLSGFFYMAAYGCYLRGRFQREIMFLGLSFILFYIGLFTKGMVVVLPLLIFVTELSFGNLTKTIRWNLIVGFCSLIVFLLMLWHWHQLRALLDIFGIGFVMPLTSPSINWEYVYTQYTIWMKYVQLSLFPFPQNFDYYWPLVKTFWQWNVVLSAAGLLLILATALLLFKRHRLISFGIFWFFIYLIPTSSGITIIEPIGEHRLYVSLAGFAIALTAALFTIIPDDKRRFQIMVGIILLLSLLTILRNQVWRSPETLFKDTISKSPLHPRPHNALGEYYYKQGRLDEAHVHFERAVELLWGWYPYSHFYLGLIARDKGHLDQAQAKFEMILSQDSNFLPAYLKLAEVLMLKKDYRRAREIWQRSLLIKPTAEAYHYLRQTDSFQQPLQY